MRILVSTCNRRTQLKPGWVCETQSTNNDTSSGHILTPSVSHTVRTATHAALTARKLCPVIVIERKRSDTQKTVGESSNGC